MRLIESYEKHLADVNKYVNTLFPDGLPYWIPIADVEKIKSTAAKYLNVPPVSIIKSIGVVFDWKINNDDEALFSRCLELNVNANDAIYFATVFRAIEGGIKNGLPSLLGRRQAVLHVNAASKAGQSRAGKGKGGHEGPLKLLLRDIMGNRQMPFDQVKDALEVGNHLMVDDFDGDTLTYAYRDKNGEEKSAEVKLPAIRRAYREIIKKPM